MSVGHWPPPRPCCRNSRLTPTFGCSRAICCATSHRSRRPRWRLTARRPNCAPGCQAPISKWPRRCCGSGASTRPQRRWTPPNGLRRRRRGVFIFRRSAHSHAANRGLRARALRCCWPPRRKTLGTCCWRVTWSNAPVRSPRPRNTWLARFKWRRKERRRAACWHSCSCDKASRHRHWPRCNRCSTATPRPTRPPPRWPATPGAPAATPRKPNASTPSRRGSTLATPARERRWR